MIQNLHSSQNYSAFYYEEVVENQLPFHIIKDIQILEKKGICSTGQVKPENQMEALSKLVANVNTYKIDVPPSKEDIKNGYELFQAIVYCPAMAIKLFRFVDQLLSSESSRTIIQTFVNLIQSGVLTDRTSFTLAKQFYKVLASTLDLQHGNVLLATSTNAHLKAARNGWPFFANNTDLVERYLQESHCDGIQDIFQNLGMKFFC